jgi:hypothetical protein
MPHRIGRSTAMNMSDILAPYAGRPTDTETDFDDVARQAPPELLGGGIAEAFRSDRTPAFGDMVGNLFGGSSMQQRGGLLGQLISTLGPALLSGVAGGALGRFADKARAGSGQTIDLDDDDVRDVTPDQVRELAIEAERKDPGIMDRLGGYYAKNPELVKILGGSALAIILGQMASRHRG